MGNEDLQPESSNGNDGLEPLLKHQENEVTLLLDPQEQTSFGYNNGHRPFRDVLFAILFLITFLATLGLGIFSILHHNSDFHWTESAHYIRNQSRCDTMKGHARPPSNALFAVYMRTEELNVNYAAQVSSTGKLSLGHSFYSVIRGPNKVFGLTFIACMIVTIALSIPIMLGVIWLLRNYTRQLVYVSLPSLFVILIGLDILWFVLCSFSKECKDSMGLALRITIFIFALLICLAFIWIVFANFARIDLTIRVLTTTAEALYNNLQLLLLVPGVSLALLIVIAPLVVFIIFAYMNGRIVPNSKLKNDPDLPCGRGTAIDCCVWKTEGWVPAYIVLAVFALLWSSFVAIQAKVFTISGTVAQWYFAPANSKLVGAMRRSLGQAFGSSFGTVCFSALIFLFVRLMRLIFDHEIRDGGGLLASFVQCCMDTIFKAVEFVTEFTMDFASITGERFCTSAKMTYDMLKRNLLSVAFVEVISSRLLAAVVFFVSLAYALVMYGVLSILKQPSNNIYVATAISWAVLIFILSLLIAIMNNIVDTVYICYAMDKDTGFVSKSDVHDVYVLLPVAQDGRARLAVSQA